VTANGHETVRKLRKKYPKVYAKNSVNSFATIRTI